MKQKMEQYAALLDQEARLEQKKKDADQGLKDTRRMLDELKAHIVTDMQESGVLQDSAAGLFFELRNVPPCPFVQDESALPEEYFKTKREVDKTKINAAIKDGIQINGVAMGNGGVTLAVRGKK